VRARAARAARALPWGAALTLTLTSALARRGWVSGPLWSLYEALSPALYLLLSLALLALVARGGRARLRRTAPPALLAASAGLALWSPAWLLRAEAPPAPPPHITLTTWNVARLGELAPPAGREEEAAARLRCVSEALAATPSDLIALQEVSRRRLSALEAHLDLRCAHIDYHGLGGGWRGGLAVCAPRVGAWRITRARDFALGGDWRALFAEVEAPGAGAGAPPRRLNLLNVHFSPLRIGARDVKSALRGGAGAVLGLLRQAGQNTARQTAQLDDLRRALETLRDPTLIAGDFNAPPHTALHRALQESLDGEWVDAWQEAGASFGATRYITPWLPLRIDFIYARAGTFEFGSAVVPRVECSDHLPVRARGWVRETPTRASGEES